MRIFRSVLLSSLLIVAAGAASDAASSSNPLADAVRTANDRFKDVSVALSEGYAPIACANGIDGGSMGIHYVNEKQLKDDAIDLAHPEAVMYEPSADGKMSLIAVEYITFKGPAELKGRVDTALVTYRRAEARLNVLQPPPSLERAHNDYLAAVWLLQQSAAEVRKMFDDGNDRGIGMTPSVTGSVPAWIGWRWRHGRQTASATTQCEHCRGPRCWPPWPPARWPRPAWGRGRRSRCAGHASGRRHGRTR